MIISGSYSLDNGESWNPIPLVEGTMPTDQDFTDTPNFIFSIIETGNNMIMSVDSLEAAGLTISN